MFSVGKKVSRLLLSFTPRELSFKLRNNYILLKDEISLSDSCIKKIEEKIRLSPDKSFLRLVVDAGEGCSGYKYNFKFENTINEDDYVYKRDDKLYFATDELTLKLIKGSRIEFVTEMIKEGFQVAENPNAEKSCSCKVSFSPKEGLI